MTSRSSEAGRVRGRPGMSLMEVLISVVVVGLALVPFLTMTFSTSKQIASVGRHLVAAQVARSVMDRLLDLPHDECRREAEALMAAGEMAVEADPEWGPSLAATVAPAGEGTGGAGSSGGAAGGIDEGARTRLFQDMRYAVQVLPPPTPEEQARLFLLEVTVSWTPDRTGSVRQSYRIKTIKYQERL